MQERELETLFQRFREQSDVRALAKVFDATAPELLAIARYLAPRRDDAEDLVQATFLTAITKAASFDGSQHLMPWLLGILSRQAHDLRRKHGRSASGEFIDRGEIDAPEREACAKELAVAVGRAIASMPDAYAMIVRRHLIDGTSPRELAEELGISPTNARVRLHRGLKLLRRALAGGIASFGGGWIPFGRWRAVRSRVLEHASAQHGVAVPLSVAPLAWIALTLITAVFAASSVWRLASSSTTQRAGGESALAADVDEALAGASASLASITPPAYSNERAPTPTAPSNASANAIERTCKVRGRMLMPDGAPAANARLICAAADGNTVSWIAPNPVNTASNGTFELELARPPKVVITLTAKCARCATIGWRWTDLSERDAIDLGEVTFERAGALSVTIADAQGRRACDGWGVDLFDASEAHPHGQDTISRRIECAGVVPLVIDDLAPRRYSVRATRGFAAEIAWTSVDVAAERTRELELRYDGPDPASRVGIGLRCKPACASSNFAPEHLRLIAPDGSRVFASAVPHRPDRFVFEGVAGEGYELSVDDERFLLWKRGGIAAGDSITVELIGSASIALRVRDAAGHEVERYSLLASCIGPARWSAASKLLEFGDEPPAGGVFDGFLPGDASLEICPDASEAELRGDNWIVQPARSASAVTLRVDGLRAGEVRTVDVSFATGVTLAGRVLAGDGATPSAGIAVELLRGGRALTSGVTRGVVVSIGDAGDDLASAGVTGNDGSFRFDSLERGEWTVRARWSQLLWVEQSVELGDAPTPVLELREPPSGWIDGVVEHCEHREGTRLIVVACGMPFDATRPRLEIEAARDGTFRLGPLPVGRIRIEALTKPGRGEGWGKSSRVFAELTNDADERTIVDVRAGAATSVRLDGREITGGNARIHVAIDGAPCRGASLVARSADVESMHRPVASRALAEVGDDGYAELEGLRPGLYDISIVASNGSWAWRHDQPLELRADRAVELELAVPLATRTVRVVDASGHPPAHRTLTSISGGIAFEMMTRDSGELELTLPVGPVRFETPGASISNAEVQWSASSDPLVLQLGGGR